MAGAIDFSDLIPKQPAPPATGNGGGISFDDLIPKQSAAPADAPEASGADWMNLPATASKSQSKAPTGDYFGDLNGQTGEHPAAPSGSEADAPSGLRQIASAAAQGWRDSPSILTDEGQQAVDKYGGIIGRQIINPALKVVGGALLSAPAAAMNAAAETVNQVSGNPQLGRDAMAAMQILPIMQGGVPHVGGIPRAPRVAPAAAIADIGKASDIDGAIAAAGKAATVTATQVAARDGVGIMEGWKRAKAENEAPADTAGPSTTMTTSSGMKVPYRWDVVDAGELKQAVGDDQPRDRAGRISSAAQVVDLANPAKFDPELLHAAPGPDQGAPTVLPDNTILAGNGRARVVRHVYAMGNGDTYRAMVERYGFDTSGMDEPMLVRRIDDMAPDQRRQLAVDSNTPTVQRMSGTEQAAIDARSLTPDLLAQYNPMLADGPIAAGNRDFVRKWVATLPQAERNAAMDADGAISADGVRRLNGAMLSAAYGDKGTLARSMESTDNNAKALTGALTDAAPAWAQLQSRIVSGEVPPEMNISAQLTRAVDMVQQAREKGISVADILAQSDAFNPVDPVTEGFLRAFHNPLMTRAASRPLVAEVLRRYAVEAGKASTAPDLFGDVRPSVAPADILATVSAAARSEPLVMPSADVAAPTAAAAGDGRDLSKSGPYRVYRVGNAPSAPNAIFPDHGLYLSPSDQAHYPESGAGRQDYMASPRNPLRVKGQPNSSPYPWSAGTEAARALLGDDEVNRILKMPEASARAEGVMRGINLPEDMRANQRLVEILGAKAAIASGYDAIIMNAKTSHGEPPELVALDKSILSPQGKPSPRSVGAAASRDMTAPHLITMPADEFAANRYQGEVERLAAPPVTNDKNVYIPGVKSTLAEVTGNPVDAMDQAYNAQQSEAMQHHMDRVNQTADLVAAYYADTAGSATELLRMERARDTAAAQNIQQVFGDPMSARPPADPTPTLELMRSIVTDPRQAERGSVTGILSSLNKKFFDTNGKLKTDPYALYGIGEHINDLLRGAGDTETSSAARVLKRELMQIKNSLYNDIEGAAPGFAKYRADYQRDSQAIDAKKLLQDERLSLLSGTKQHITPAKWFSFMRNIVEGRADPMDPASALSEDQMDRLWDITDQLKRQTLIDAGKPRGSWTSMMQEWGGKFARVAAHGVAAHSFPVIGNLGVEMAVAKLRSRSVHKEMDRVLNPNVGHPPGP